MDFRFAERYLPVLNLGLIVLLAYLAALSVDDVVRLHLAPSPGLMQSAPTNAQAAPGLRPRSYYDAIVKRDIFNLAPAPEVAQPTVPTARDLSVKLVGTSLTSLIKPFAILEDKRSGQQTLYRLGDNVPDAGTLAGIERDRVIFDQSGHRVALEMEGKPPTPEAPVGPRAGMAVRGVSPMGRNHFVIARSTINNSLSNMARLFTEVRAVPNFVNGHSTGFRLSDIQPGSLFAEIGLHDGDLLTRLNGQGVTDPARAMQLFSQLRNQPSITADIIRGGRPMRIHYDIR